MWFVKIVRKEQKDFIKTVQYSFGMLKDLPQYYQEAPIEVKHKIVGSIFPEKLVYREKNYRTAQVNQALALICSNINDFGEVKQKQTASFGNPSSQVAPARIELASRV